MAVYERRYVPWAGEASPEWQRFLVIPRYCVPDAFQSRLFSSLYLVSFLPFLLGIVGVYLPYNINVLHYLNIEPAMALEIGEKVLDVFLRIQSGLIFVLALMLGPTLLASDLRNNAICLYLSRPFSKGEYILGNFASIFLLLSPSTWFAGLLLFVLRAYMAGGGWALDNWRVGFGLVVSLIVFITVMSLLALACSAWAKTRLVARGAMLFVIILMAGLGDVFNLIFQTKQGDLLDLMRMFELLHRCLIGDSEAALGKFWMPILSLGGTAAFSVVLIWRQVRAQEVVR